MWAGIDDAETTKAIRIAFDLGMNVFDTAATYGDGHSEKILGKALSDVRGDAIIATKVFFTQLKYEQVIESCHQSLINLNTDYIDLFQIHWPAGTFASDVVPIEETMRAMQDLKQQGKIRAMGLSNFSLAQIQEAEQCMQIDSIQPPYSLFWRHAETDIIPYCVDNEITVLAYSPLAQGLLTGKFGLDHKFGKGDHRAKNRLFNQPHSKRVQLALEQLRPIAVNKGISLSQLALAWVMGQIGVCPIAGARKPEQVTENVRAASVSLSEEEIQQMDEISRTVTDHLDDNPILWDF